MITAKKLLGRYQQVTKSVKVTKKNKIGSYSKDFFKYLLKACLRVTKQIINVRRLLGSYFKITKKK